MHAALDTGNAAEDALLVRRIKAVVDVPEAQIMTFINSRDRTHVARLQRVLENMPEGRRGAASSTSSRRSCRCSNTSARDQSGAIAASYGLAPSASCPALRGTSPETAARPSSIESTYQRLDEMRSSRTTYSHTFNLSGGVGSTPQQAFNGMIRRSYRGEFDAWRQGQASESDLKVLAEACRAMRFVCARSKGRPSLYAEDFPKHVGHVRQQPSVHPLAQQASNVPLGGLGNGPSSLERELKEERDTLHNSHLSMAQSLQSSMSRGEPLTVEARDKAKLKVNLSQYCSPPGATLKPGENQGPPAGSNNWQSTSRATWTADIHSMTSRAKNGGHSIVQKGDPDRKLKAQQFLLETLSKEAFDRGDSMKNLVGSKSGVFCVSKKNDPLGKQSTSKFHYATFA